jgi:hypothetical protein
MGWARGQISQYHTILLPWQSLCTLSDLVKNFPTNFSRAKFLIALLSEYVKVIGCSPDLELIQSLTNNLRKLCRSLKRQDAALSSALGKAFLSVKLPVIILEKETEDELDKVREKEQEVESPQQRPRKSFGALTSTGKWYRLNSLSTKERLAYLYASAKKKRVEEPKDLDQRKKDNAAVLLYFEENRGKIECVVSKKHLVMGKTTFQKVWLTRYATIHYRSHL